MSQLGLTPPLPFRPLGHFWIWDISYKFWPPPSDFLDFLFWCLPLVGFHPPYSPLLWANLATLQLSPSTSSYPRLSSRHPWSTTSYPSTIYYQFQGTSLISRVSGVGVEIIRLKATLFGWTSLLKLSKNNSEHCEWQEETDDLLLDMSKSRIER